MAEIFSNDWQDIIGDELEKRVNKNKLMYYQWDSKKTLPIKKNDF